MPAMAISPSGADEEGACTLLEEVLEVGAEADSGEGEQEGPAAEVAERE